MGKDAVCTLLEVVLLRILCYIVSTLTHLHLLYTHEQFWNYSLFFISFPTTQNLRPDHTSNVCIDTWSIETKAIVDSIAQVCECCILRFVGFLNRLDILACIKNAHPSSTTPLYAFDPFKELASCPVCDGMCPCEFCSSSDRAKKIRKEAKLGDLPCSFWWTEYKALEVEMKSKRDGRKEREEERKQRAEARKTRQKELEKLDRYMRWLHRSQKQSRSHRVEQRIPTEGKSPIGTLKFEEKGICDAEEPTNDLVEGTIIKGDDLMVNNDVRLPTTNTQGPFEEDSLMRLLMDLDQALSFAPSTHATSSSSGHDYLSDGNMESIRSGEQTMNTAPSSIPDALPGLSGEFLQMSPEISSLPLANNWYPLTQPFQAPFAQEFGMPVTNDALNGNAQHFFAHLYLEDNSNSIDMPVLPDSYKEM